MTKFNCIAVGIVFALNLWAQNSPGPHQWNASVEVVDEAGLPVPEAQVSINYFVEPAKSQNPHVPSYETIKGTTDRAGMFAASHRDMSKSLGFSIQKQGFYPSDYVHQLGIPLEYNAARWNPVIKATIKKIGRPIPMFAKLVDSGPPVSNKSVGYDFSVGDWVEPYGKGKKTNIVFNQQLKEESQNEFDSTLTIHFPNQGDGIQEFKAQDKPREGSALRSPHEAPADGYQRDISRVLNRHPGQGTKSEFDPNRNYFFRTRTVLDENGQVKSALYGKIYGDFSEFRYYLNPTPNNRNVEFDPMQNLLGASRSSARALFP